MKVKERLLIPEFNHFGGKHCWTTALRGVLFYHGLSLSEEMLFGLGGGPGFIYWYMKRMPAPFIGTRYGKFDSLIKTCKRIGAKASIFETGSSAKGYNELKKVLRANEPAFVFVDMAYLPYFALPGEAHFGGHTVVVYGLDEEEDKVYISDCAHYPVSVTIEELKRARNSKYPPYPPKNRILKITYPKKTRDLRVGIREAIRECCTGMLKPPIKNLGLAGIKKWAGLVLGWPKEFKGMSLLGCLMHTYIYIEVSGTGGSAFRTMYAQFLREASPILHNQHLNDVADIFEQSAKAWTQIANAALPDDWPLLKKIRELSFEKNRLFREEATDATEKMLNINREMDSLMKEAIDEITKKDLKPLLSNLQKKILLTYELEEEAFVQLKEVLYVKSGGIGNGGCITSTRGL